ncbi:MAG: 30S ribosomal protein S19e [Candidatus Pacearchaeota archaeon]
MASIYEIDPAVYNKFLAEELKKIQEFKVPKWSLFVKTSVARARPPAEKDWWYKRAASILRQIYIKGVVGVNRLKTRYGGRKDRGMKPAEFRKGSGKIIRTILQQGEKAGFLQKSRGKRKGRELTKEGKKFLEDVAEKIKNNNQNIK